MNEPLEFRPSAFLASQWAVLPCAGMFAGQYAIVRLLGKSPPVWVQWSWVGIVAAFGGFAWALARLRQARALRIDGDGIEVERGATTRRVNWEEVTQLVEEPDTRHHERWMLVLREQVPVEVSTLGLSSQDRRLVRARLESALGDRLVRRPASWWSSLWERDRT
jgi:hypothetical protein